MPNKVYLAMPPIRSAHQVHKTVLDNQKKKKQPNEKANPQK